MATAGPWLVACVAMMNAAIEATVPTDRSMPPVSIASVWQPARIASGIAARIVEADPVVVWTVPGWASSRTTMRMTSSAVSGMSGRSRNRRRLHRVASGLRARRLDRAGCAVMRRTRPHREDAAEHDDRR